MVLFYLFFAVIFDEKIVNQAYGAPSRKKLIEVISYSTMFNDRIYSIYYDDRDGFNNIYFDVVEGNSVVDSHTVTDFSFYPEVVSCFVKDTDSLIFIVWKQMYDDNSTLKKPGFYMDVVSKKTGEVLWNNVFLTDDTLITSIVLFSDSSFIFVYGGTSYRIYNWLEGKFSEERGLCDDGVSIVSYGWLNSKRFYMIGRDGSVFYLDASGNVEKTFSYDKDGNMYYINSVPTPDSGFIMFYMDEYDNGLLSVKFSWDGEEEKETRIGETDPMSKIYDVTNFDGDRYVYLVNHSYLKTELIKIDEDGVPVGRREIDEYIQNFWEWEVASLNGDVFILFTEPLSRDTTWGGTPASHIYGMRFLKFNLLPDSERFLIREEDSVRFNFYPVVSVNSEGYVALAWKREPDIPMIMVDGDVYFSILSPYNEFILEPQKLENNVSRFSLDMGETHGCYRRCLRWYYTGDG